ncbi:MAG: hypothetical protein R2867_06180 [Caldilineaceae bacterium]
MRIQTKLTYASPDDPLHKRLLIRSIETLTGQRKLTNIYHKVLEMVPEEHDGHAIWPTILNELAIHADYDRAQLGKAPKEGPVILIANHPYGVLDGLIICHLAAQLRRDFKILIHKALCIEPRVERYLLPVDFSETEEAVQLNIETKQRAMMTLREGGDCDLSRRRYLNHPERSIWPSGRSGVETLCHEVDPDDQGDSIADLFSWPKQSSLSTCQPTQ